MKNKILKTLLLLSLTLIHLPLYSGDHDLVNLTSHEMKTLGDVYRHFDELISYYTLKKDRRRLFVLVYKKTTLSIHSLIIQGKTYEPHWLERTIVGFAEEYRKAVNHYESGELRSTPLPWRLDFDKSKDHSIGLATQLLLSMNSHILHDLPIVIAQDDEGKNVLYRYKEDFFSLNDMFKGLIPKYLDIVYREAHQKPTFYYHPSEVLKRTVIEQVVMAMRQVAWDRALKLSTIVFPEDKEAYIRHINWHVLKMSELVLELDPFLSIPPGDLLPSHVVSNTWRAVSEIYTALGYSAPPTELHYLFKNFGQL